MLNLWNRWFTESYVLSVQSHSRERILIIMEQKKRKETLYTMDGWSKFFSFIFHGRIGSSCNKLFPLFILKIEQN